MLADAGLAQDEARVRSAKPRPQLFMVAERGCVGAMSEQQVAAMFQEMQSLRQGLQQQEQRHAQALQQQEQRHVQEIQQLQSRFHQSEERGDGGHRGERGHRVLRVRDVAAGVPDFKGPAAEWGNWAYILESVWGRGAGGDAGDGACGADGD